MQKDSKLAADWPTVAAKKNVILLRLDSFAEWSALTAVCTDAESFNIVSHAVSVGSAVTLECDSSDVSGTRWDYLPVYPHRQISPIPLYIPNKNTSSEDVNHILSSLSNDTDKEFRTLIIENVQRSMAGAYVCQSTKDDTKIGKRNQLIVIGTPCIAICILDVHCVLFRICIRLESIV